MLMKCMLKKLFIGCPISHYFENGVFNNDLKGALLYIEQCLHCKGDILFSAPIEEKFQLDHSLTDDQIAQRDFSWIDESDACAFFLPTDSLGNPIQTEGTCIELGYSVAMNKPLIIFWNSSAAENYSPLVRGLHGFHATYYDVSKFREVVTIFG